MPGGRKAQLAQCLSKGKLLRTGGPTALNASVALPIGTARSRGSGQKVSLCASRWSQRRRYPLPPLRLFPEFNFGPPSPKAGIMPLNHNSQMPLGCSFAITIIEIGSQCCIIDRFACHYHSDNRRSNASADCRKVAFLVILNAPVHANTQ